MRVDRNAPVPEPLTVYRVIAGRSQAELAELAGIRAATVCELEKGRRRPHRSTAEALADVLEVDPCSLFPRHLEASP